MGTDATAQAACTSVHRSGTDCAIQPCLRCDDLEARLELITCSARGAVPVWRVRPVLPFVDVEDFLRSLQVCFRSALWCSASN